MSNATAVVKDKAGNEKVIPWEELSLDSLRSGDVIPVSSNISRHNTPCNVGELFGALVNNSKQFLTRLEVARALGEAGEEGYKALAIGLEWSIGKPPARLNAVEKILYRTNTTTVPGACRKVLGELAQTNPICADILLQHQNRRIQAAQAEQTKSLPD